MTKKEFYKSEDMKKIRTNITTSAIIGYVCVLISLFSAVKSENYSAFIDLAIVLITSLLIHLIQSRVASIILLVYSIINLIYSIVVLHMPSGYLIVIAGIYATIYTFIFHKAWKDYRKSSASYSDSEDGTFD